MRTPASGDVIGVCLHWLHLQAKDPRILYVHQDTTSELRRQVMSLAFALHLQAKDRQGYPKKIPFLTKDSMYRHKKIFAAINHAQCAGQNTSFS
jgi:hypothetical protein